MGSTVLWRAQRPQQMAGPFRDRVVKEENHSVARFNQQKESYLAAQQAIRECGLRATSPRTATLVLLREAQSPLTHAEVAEALAAAGIDKATAFRNLNDLAEVELVRRTEVGDHVWRFEAVDTSRVDHGHPHFLCVDCGSVTCLGDVQLTAGSRRESAEIGEVTEILLRGHCNQCL